MLFDLILKDYSTYFQQSLLLLYFFFQANLYALSPFEEFDIFRLLQTLETQMSKSWHCPWFQAPTPSKSTLVIMLTSGTPIHLINPSQWLSVWVWESLKKENGEERKKSRRVLWSIKDQLEVSFPGGWAVKESACNIVDLGSMAGLGRSPGGGHDNPLQHSCLENPVDRGAWQVAVHRVTESWTRLKKLSSGRGQHNKMNLTLVLTIIFLHPTISCWVQAELGGKVKFNQGLDFAKVSNLAVLGQGNWVCA